MLRTRFCVSVLLLSLIAAVAFVATPSLGAQAGVHGPQGGHVGESAGLGGPVALWLAGLGLSAVFVRRGEQRHAY